MNAILGKKLSTSIEWILWASMVWRHWRSLYFIWDS